MPSDRENHVSLADSIQLGGGSLAVSVQDVRAASQALEWQPPTPALEKAPTPMAEVPDAAVKDSDIILDVPPA